MTLTTLTPEERQLMLEKARTARSQKKTDNIHIKTDYMDLNHWRELSSLYGCRLPILYYPATELKYLKRCARKLNVDVAEFVETTGCKTLKEFASINPTMSAACLVGVFLEWFDETHSEATV